MKIWHRLGFLPDAEMTLRQLGVHYEIYRGTPGSEKVTGLFVLIDESDPAWLAISELGGSETAVETEFTDEEVLSAEWLLASPRHSIGYALPSGVSWSKEYYELGCKSCGVGWKQVAPFRVNSQTRLGKHAFASFAGGFELFCSLDVLDAFEAEGVHGFDTWPLLLSKAKAPLPGIRQLIIEGGASRAIVEELAETRYFAMHRCSDCQRTWFNYYRRGMLPVHRGALRQGVDFQLTDEWFGNGRTARHEILVSRRVAHLVLRHRWRGLHLSPVHLVD